jgi:hypothetical protein
MVGVYDLGPVWNIGKENTGTGKPQELRWHTQQSYGNLDHMNRKR